MKNDSIEKLLDEVISDCKISDVFAVYTFLVEKKKISDKNEQSELWYKSQEVIKLGETYNYWSEEGSGGGWVRVTKLGIEAQKKGGHFKHQRYLRKKESSWDSHKIITTIISIAAPLFLAVFAYYSDKKINKLEQENITLTIKIDSLNKILVETKSSANYIDSIYDPSHLKNN